MSYKDSDIKVLKGLEPVRKRPGMYIGSTDVRGLHHLIWELLDNAVDEAMSGYANRILIALNLDGSITVKDNGRGIPIGMNATTRKSTVDTVFTSLHAGGKFNNNAYNFAGGLHGVGASVVNALSEWMNVEVYVNGYAYESQYFDGGKIKQSLTKIGKTSEKGTKITFFPDRNIFPSIEFKPSIIKERLQETSFLFKSLEIIFSDIKNNFKEVYKSDNGIVEFVKFINENKKAICNVIYFNTTVNEIDIEIALQYVSDSSETIISFANSIKTFEGGSHETGFKIGLLDVFNEYARKVKILKEKDQNFDSTDVREGITAIISVKVPEKLISYEGQTKNKLFTQEAYGSVKKTINSKLLVWLEQNKKEALKILEKILISRNARLAAKSAREEVRHIKNSQRERSLSGKLSPCQSKLKDEIELFLVEGDSAGGTAKLGRNRKYQAILPLKGKVLNVEKASLKDVVLNEEISTIVSCLGAGIGKDFDLNKLKYKKIIIMTDADTDGSHIQILILTFFYRYMRKLIENGNVYIALPPLYKVSKKGSKEYQYVWDNIELQSIKEAYGSCDIQRYKGLGEMNADQLWESTMDPERRKIIRVNIGDLALVEKRVFVLMGDDTNVRKEWIDENIDFELNN
ncbi:MAG: DNA topoisomerase IV subunit B [Mycoplasmoidaceae bacterium]